MYICIAFLRCEKDVGRRKEVRKTCYQELYLKGTCREIEKDILSDTMMHGHYLSPDAIIKIRHLA